MFLMEIRIESPVEKEVLVFLAVHPDISDGDISDKTGYDIRKVRLIRRKWISHGLLKKVMVPDFYTVGFELLTVIHGDFNIETPYKKRRRYLPSKKFDQIFYVQASDLQHVSMSAAKNFTQTRRYMDYMESIYGRHNFFAKDANSYIWFPLELSKINKFFDYGYLIADRMGIDIDCPQKKPSEKVMSLSINEKSILKFMVESPNDCDMSLSAKSGLSRQTIGKIRKKLICSGAVSAKTSIDISMLGYMYTAFRCAQFTPNAKEQTISFCEEHFKKDPNTFWHITSKYTFASLSAYRTYREYEKAERQCRRLLMDQCIIWKKTRLFRFEDAHVSDHMYGRIMSERA